MASPYFDPKPRRYPFPEGDVKAIKAFRGQLATFALTIAQPLYRDPDLGGVEAQADLTRRLHEEVCRLANIDPEQNPCGPIFHDDKRVDYY